MPVRPGRLLPSVIVGALVTGALALGAGTASAEDPITDILGATDCLLDNVPVPMGSVYERDANNECKRITVPSTGDQTGAEEDDSDDPSGGGVVITVPSTPGGGSSVSNPPPADEEDDESDPVVTTPDTGTATPGSGSVVVAAPPVIVPRPSALPAPDVRGGVVPTANLLSPGGSYGGLAATTPTLGFGTLNPALLFAPQGSPLRTLTSDQGSPVTTVSDVQAMAFDDLPGGLGTPAITGTLILSAFAAFALRHRVLRHARLAADADAGVEADESDTAEIPTRQPVG